MPVRLFRVQPQTTNIGNDLIALSSDRLLAAAFPEPLTIVTLPATGGTGPKAGGLDARNVYAMNQLADGVLIGGGNLFENGGLRVDPTALAALSVPLGVVGVSTGRIAGRHGALVARTDALPPDQVRAIARHAAPLLVRDVATIRHLEGLGVAHAVLAGCPTFSLADTLVDAHPLDPTLEGVTLLSVRHPQLMSVPPVEQDRVRRDVRAIVGELRSAGHGRVEFLCHDYQDLAFAAAYPDVPVRYTEDARTLVAWLRSCASSVGYRLHGFLAALACGTPAVHVSYDERGTSMMETIGLTAWDVPMRCTPDVAGAIVDRLGTLDELARLRSVAEPQLDAMRATMADELARFARAVMDGQRPAAVPA